MGAGVSYNVRWWTLAALIVGGSVSAWLIAVLVPPTSRFLTGLFLGYATYGLVFAVKQIRHGWLLLRKAEEPDVSLVGRVYAVAALRREILRGVGHVVVFVLGVVSLLRLSWFGQMFVASMFMLIYVMDVNATLDDTLDRRMRRAEAEETRRAVERARIEKMAEGYTTLKPRAKRKPAKRKPKR